MNGPQQVIDETTTRPEAADTPLADGEEQATAETVDPAYADRRRRICQYRMESLENLNPLNACLAGVNSDLLDFELHLGEVLRQTIASGGASLDDIQRHSAAIDMLIRLSKQITQISQLPQRSRNSHNEATAGKRR